MRWRSLLAIAVGAGLASAAATATADLMKNIDGEWVCGKGECRRDLYGQVLCSAFFKGSAVRTLDGRILCGRGRCVTTSRGEVFCSTMQEGSAVLDLHGVARCLGRCEPASAEYCEAEPAGTVPE